MRPPNKTSLRDGMRLSSELANTAASYQQPPHVQRDRKLGKGHKKSHSKGLDFTKRLERNDISDSFDYDHLPKSQLRGSEGRKRL